MQSDSQPLRRGGCFLRCEWTPEDVGEVDVLEFKYYHPRRGKWWSSKLGVFVYLAIPKDKIEVVEKAGMSYPIVKINGQEVTLSVGGGTSENGWTDHIGNIVSTFVNMPVRKVKKLAEVALSIGDAKRAGITLEVENKKPYRWRDESDEDYEKRTIAEQEADRKRIQEEYAKVVCMSKLKEGHGVAMHGAYSFRNTDFRGPFLIDRKPARKQHYIVTAVEYAGSAPMRTTLYYKMIYWVGTAKLNNFDITPPVPVNRVAA